jgi:hypothetical protein
MAEFRAPERPQGISQRRSVKTCPWCNGSLVFEPRYPVMRLIPGATTRVPREDDVPEPLRTVAAWVCGTPHCRFREPA